MVHAVLVDTCTLANFAAADRLDLLKLALDGRGRWTDAAAHETGRATDDWPTLRSLHVAGWLGEPVEVGMLRFLPGSHADPDWPL